MIGELSESALKVIAYVFTGMFPIGYFPKKRKNSVIMASQPGKDCTSSF